MKYLARQHGCQLASKRRRFFISLVNVIRGARNHLSTNQVDSAEFWCRRLDQYERTLRLLSARVEESRPGQITFIRDLESLETLMDTMGDLREL